MNGTRAREDGDFLPSYPSVRSWGIATRPAGHTPHTPHSRAIRACVMEFFRHQENYEKTKVRGKNAAGHVMSGIRDLEYTEPAVHPLPESRRPEHGTADCGRHRAYSAGRNEARAVFRRGERSRHHPTSGGFGSFHVRERGGSVYRKCSLAVNLKNGFPLSSGLLVDQGEANGESDLTEGYVRLRFHGDGLRLREEANGLLEAYRSLQPVTPGLGARWFPTPVNK
jgi:hypothetical protein